MSSRSLRSLVATPRAGAAKRTLSSLRKDPIYFANCDCLEPTAGCKRRGIVMRRANRLVLFAISALTLTATFPAASWGSFCGSPVARDYEAPLRSLPAAQPVPWVLPFGPSEIRTRGPSLRRGGLAGLGGHLPGKRLVYRGASLGVLLWNPNDTELTLNWRIKARVASVRADGAPSVSLSEGVADVAVLRPNGSLAVPEIRPPAMGTLRMDITFLDAEETVLGSFFEYLQIVPFKVDPRLRLKTRVVPPGGELLVRLVNWGTTQISSPGAYRLQRYERNRWQDVPVEDLPASGPALAPGAAGRCQRMPIQDKAEPGLYRIQTRVRSLRRRQGKVRRAPIYVSKTFRVTGGLGPAQRQ